MMEELEPKKITQRLPFPPTLPYSPDSLPFMRQVEILSLCISSASADDSWQTYHHIHADLRRYIPDNIFRSLIAHQLADDEVRRRWSRTTHLLRFAKKCGMEAKELGKEVVEMALIEGLRHALEAPMTSREKHFGLIRHLWRFLVQLVKGDTAQISMMTRQYWLHLHLQRALHGGSEAATIAHRGIAKTALQELLLGGGLRGLETVAGQIITSDKTLDLAVQIEILQQIATYWNRGIELPTAAAVSVMTRLRSAWERIGENGTSKLREDVSRLVAEMPPSNGLVTYLQGCVEAVSGLSRSPEERAFELVETENPSVPALIREGLKVLRSLKKSEGLKAIDLAISLLERAVRQRDANCDALVAQLLANLLNQPNAQHLITRFAVVLLSANILQHLDSNLVHFLFHLVLSTGMSDKTYILARKVYPFARTTETSFRWSHRNLWLWRKLFHYAISSDRANLHFASRLYADLLADGMAIRSTDAIAMIRAIGTSRGASRRILLERHVKDYVWMEYGSRQAFLRAIVQGLTSSGRSDDQLAAFNLILRLSVDRPVPTEVANMLLSRLPKSPEGICHRYFLDLLRLLPAIPDTVASYNTAISTIISSANAMRSPAHLSPVEALGRAFALYQDMIKRDIPPTSPTINLIIRGLCHAEYLDSALKVFYASIDIGLVVFPNTAGSLMVRLALVGRFEDALDVEKKWKDVAQPHRDSLRTDRGVNVARVIVGLQRGVEVDMSEAAKSAGFSGPDKLRRFIEQLISSS